MHGLTILFSFFDEDTPSAVVCLSFVRVSIHSSNGGARIVLREAGGRRCAGCGLNQPPSLNGMTLWDIDIMENDYNTKTRGSLVACAACRGRNALHERRARSLLRRAARVGALLQR